MTYIPKIIHQLWIGNKPAPIKFMNTWKEKHPNFEYIYWNEDELVKRNFRSQLNNKINEMEEINGKADILRWEILYKYGGIFLDADSICIEPFDNLLELNKCFASYENETIRGVNWCKNNPEFDDVLARTHSLIATGTMAFPPNHELPKMAIEWIKNNVISVSKTGRRAWRTVGPGLLTRLYYSRKWDDITILPSYYFLPVHCSGLKYMGHGKVYAYQEWGSTKDNYEIMNNIDLPDEFNKPVISISILIPCYNINASYFKECIESIKNQIGNIYINLVCINDGSNHLSTILMKRILDDLKKNSRWINIIYVENEENLGISKTLNKGVLLCPDEIIFRMDSDDIMINNRIYKQLEFMLKNKDCVMCGTQIAFFNNNKASKNSLSFNINNITGRTSHPNYTFEEYKIKKSHWIMNHPTLCFIKSAIIEVGNYNNNIRGMIEDLDLELRVLKKYGKIYNLPDILLYYRLHNNQLTYNGGTEGSEYWINKRNELINNLINI